LDYNIRSRRSDAGDDHSSADLANAHDPYQWQASSSSDGKTVSETGLSSDGNTIAKIDYTIGGDGIEHIKASSYSDGVLEKQEDVFTNGTSAIKYLDPRNTHPYTELDIDEDASGKVTAATPKIDGQPSGNVDFSAVGQVLGSALGRALAPNNQFVQLAAGTVIGAVGQTLAQAFVASLRTDAASVSFASAFATDFQINIAGAGASSVASFLVAEFGTALHLDGFGAQLFNAGAGGFAGSVASQIATKMATGLSFDAAIAGVNFASAAASAAYGISSLLGSYLGHELVPAQTHEGAVGGQLLGAVGSAIGISAALSGVLGGVLGFIAPGIGSLMGTVLGTLIGDALAPHPHPAALDLIDQVGYLYGYTHSQISASDGGDYTIPDPMAAAAVSIINTYLGAVKGAALDHSTQTQIGYVTDPSFRYIDGWAPTHQYYSFLGPDDAVHRAALDVLQHTEVIGGDLLLKRAHANSTASIPDPKPEWAGLITPSSQSGTEKLATLSADLSVAQDYENYLNNREAINALMATNPNSAFAAGWIATFARVNDLGLNHMSGSDFLGGLVGYLDSVNKAGLGAEAANAVVKRGSDNSVIVEIKVANGVEIPGSLSVFADHLNITSDAGGQTLQFTVDSGLGASGTLLLGPGTGSGGHDIMVGGAGNDNFAGGAGFDFIDGGAGSDYLFGQDGNDILRGGLGTDFLFGGLGNDTYVFNRGDGADTVLDDFTVTTPGYSHDVWRDEDGDGTNELHHDWVPETTDHPNAGTDTLLFGPGIAQSDITLIGSGNDLIVYVKSDVPWSDTIKLQHWFDDPKDRVEKFAFADGTTLDLSSGILAPYLVPFGETLSHGSVVEKSAVGTVVGTVTGFDFSGANLTYSMIDGAGGRFAINASTGVLTVAGAINYDDAHSWQIVTRVSDGAHVFDKAFTINVIDLPNHAPVLSVPASTIKANPGQSMQASSLFSASDADGDALSYIVYDNTISAGGGHFMLNGVAVPSDTPVPLSAAQLAQLTFVAGAAGSSSDLYVKAYDGHVYSGWGEVHVNVNRVHSDFNGDGRSDVLWRNDSGSVAVWDSAVAGHVVGAADAGWHIAGVGDFDGNGKADILWQSDTGAVAVWDNGTPAGGHVVADAGATAGWHIAGVGDFDGNHHDDVLLRSDSGAVAVWDNGTPAGGHVVGDAAANWHIAGVGDFDGNGKADVLWQSDTGAVAVWDNGTPAGGHVVGDADAGWHIAGAGDFDGNGKADVLWQSDSGAVAVWDNGTAAGGHAVGAADASWHIAGVGDFDGNGKADVLWRNDSGAVALWDNGTPAGGHMVAESTAASWHIVDVVNHAPVLTMAASSVTMEAGQSLQVSTLFSATDADNDALTYYFQDGNAANSGHFVLNGTAYANGAGFGLSAAQLANLTYVAGADGSADDISMQLSDGYAGSAIGQVHFNVVNHAPVLTMAASSVMADAGQSLQVSSWFSATDADHDALTYYFQDGTIAVNSGQFVLNGTPLGQGAGFGLSAAQLAGLTFVASATGVSDDVSMQLSDGFAVSAALGLRVNVNHAPTDATLSGGSVVENAPTGTSVGTVTGVDPDAGTTFSYSLRDPDGRFAINASSGEITVANGALIDYDTAAAYQITVRTADQRGLFFDKSFTINASNVNEAPTDATLFGGTVREHSPNGTQVGTVIGADPDAGGSLSYSLLSDAGGRFAILNPASGAITVKDGTLLDYATAQFYSLMVRTTDQGGLFYDRPLTVSIAAGPVNNPDGTSTVTIYDTADSFGWSSFKSTYSGRDGHGSLLSQLGTNDGGSTWQNVYDVAHSQSWDHTTSTFDAAGHLLTRATTNDDGTHALTVNDVAGAANWSSFTMNFDAGWNYLSLGNVTMDPGQTLDMGQVWAALDTLTWYSTPYAVGPAQVAAVSDFNGDGKTDLLLLNDSTSGWYVCEMNGAQIGVNAQVGTIAAGWHYDRLGDFNADGKSDVVLLNDSTHQVDVIEMDGIEMSSNGVVATVRADLGWYYKGLGDFNNDGKSDLILFNDATHGVYVCEMDGLQMGPNALSGTIAAGWAYQTLGDFNGDGKADFLFLNAATHGVEVWQMDGAQIAADQVVGSIDAGAGWRFKDTADFNGDGKSDLLLLNDANNHLMIWQMDGVQTPLQVDLGAAPAGTHFLAKGDFNGDGKADLAFLNDTTAAVTVWQMNGTQLQAAAQVGSVPAGYHYMGEGDFNADQKTDLVFQNDATRAEQLWQMNGTAILDNSQMALLAAGWHLAI
jgi:hypothetical protein